MTKLTKLWLYPIEGGHRVVGREPDWNDPRLITGVDIIGPEAVYPPGGSLSGPGRDRWIADLRARGFAVRQEVVRPVPPSPVDVLVEAVSYTEAELDGQPCQGDRDVLQITVENLSTVPVPALSVAFAFEEVAPAGAKGTMPAAGLAPDIPANVLPPGAAIAFYIVGDRLAETASSAAAMSSESYFLSVHSGRTEIMRVPGARLGDALDSLLR